MKLIVICTGNICRSAMAGVVLSVQAEKLGLSDKIVIDSAGVSDEEQGNPMDPRAVDALRKRGYDVSSPLVRNHRALKLSAEDAKTGDLFLAMTRSHASALTRTFRIPAEKVKLWRAFETSEDGSDSNAPDLADPWYGGSADFDLALDQIEASAEKVLKYAAKI